jgi:hypothetical protein
MTHHVFSAGTLWALGCGFFLSYWALAMFLTLYEAMRPKGDSSPEHREVLKAINRASLIGALIVDVVVLGWWLNT